MNTAITHVIRSTVLIDSQFKFPSVTSLLMAKHYNLAQVMFNNKPAKSFRPGLPPLIEVKDWDKSREDYC